MKPDLPESLEPVLRPLFQALPLNSAMTTLVVHSGQPVLTQTTGDGLAETGFDVRHKAQRDAGRHDQTVEQVTAIVEHPALAANPALVAGLWLYVDELELSHEASQQLHTPTGAYWHAVMHRREGDFSNSRYWYRKAGQHPVIRQIDLSGGPGGAGTCDSCFNPIDFVDRVERAQNADSASPDLIALQRTEWLALFQWCANNQ